MAQRILNDPDIPEPVRAMARRRLEVTRTGMLLYADPPLHNRQRRLVNRAFTPRRVRKLAPAIRTICNDLVDAMDATSDVDLNRQYSVLVPMYVIADALGVPRSESATFKRWSDAFVVGNGNPLMTRDEIIAALTSINEFYDYFLEQMEDRRKHPRDDILTVIVESRIEGEVPLTEAEQLQALAQFLVAGNETTAKLLSSTVIQLLRDRALEQTVRADTTLIPALVEEVLRLCGPQQGLFRTATRDTELGGVHIPAGSMLFLSYASGNRDDEIFPDPHSLDIHRDLDRPHLAFGHGEHFCLGASLAREEARIGIEVLLARTERLELVGDVDSLEYQPTYAMHGVKRLPLRMALRPEPPASCSDRIRGG